MGSSVSTGVPPAKGHDRPDAIINQAAVPSSSSVISKVKTSVSGAPESQGTTTVAEDHSYLPSSPDANNNHSEGGGCPMKQQDGSYSFDWGALFRPEFPHGPGGSKALPENVSSLTSPPASASEPTTVSSSPSSACPMSAGQKSSVASPNNKQLVQYNVYGQPLVDPQNNLPVIANQMPASGQSKPLSTERVSSTIPKGGAPDGTTWTYPSPQMFYNALARKGKLGVSAPETPAAATTTTTAEDDMDSVVALHNHMNEKTWRAILQWEQVATGTSSSSPSFTTTTTTTSTNQGDEDSSRTTNAPTSSSSSWPKLLKFQGRPTDLSPKARFKHWILGHPLPFDRHDWVVVRQDGTVVRYVIDYYYDESRARTDEASARPHFHDPQATQSLLIDVRPALDRPQNLWTRAVTMPWAQYIRKSTDYVSLPLRPSASMHSQVSESIQVWQDIQRSKAPSSSSRDDVSASLTEEQAKEVVQSFATALSSCRQARQTLDQCSNDAECARASMDWSICMGKMLCPVQHESLIKALKGGPTPEQEAAALEAALSSLQGCVLLKSQQQAEAKKRYPSLSTVA